MDHVLEDPSHPADPASRTVPAATAAVPTANPSVGQRAAARTARTADVIVDLLEAAGVDVVFGLPGGAISPVFDALLDRPGIRLVNCRHEAGAIFAAIGHARASGRLGVVAVTSGPGFLNTMTGLAAAHADGVPILVLAGEVARASQGKGGLQEGSAHALNVIGMASHVCKFSCEAPTASAAPNLVRRAIEVAQSDRGGPTAITLPLDVLTKNIRVPRMHEAGAPFRAIDPLAVEGTAKALVASRRRVILAGSGVREGRGPEYLRQVAERLGCPVITTPKAKGVFPESHPLALGIFGIGGHPSTTEFLQQGVETVLALGTSFSDLATNGWSELLRPSRMLVHVDVDASRIGRAYEPQVSVIARAEPFLAELVARLPSVGRPAGFGVGYHQDPEARATGKEGLITPQRALWELQRSLPSDVVYTVDSGEHNVFALHYIVSDLPDSFQVMSGLGAMGSSVPAAVGVALAQPGRSVAALCGDGGFAMCAAELSTASQHGLPIVVAVFDDGRLGMVEIGHRQVYGRSPDFGLETMSVARLAEAFGAEVVPVDAPGQILAMQDKMRSPSRPLVLAIRIDRSESMPRNARTQKLVRDMGWPGEGPGHSGGRS